MLQVNLPNFVTRSIATFSIREIDTLCYSKSAALCYTENKLLVLYVKLPTSSTRKTVTPCYTLNCHHILHI